MSVFQTRKSVRNGKDDSNMSATTNWNPEAPALPKYKSQGSPLLYLLGFVSALFIGILVFCYVVTKRANPILLDVDGHPVTQSSGTSHH